MKCDLQLEWVNHASFIVDDGEIRLMTDPWLEGRVFNNSWSLLSQTKFQYDEFKNIDYIWFSHEHPDHFFPPNLKKIPEEYRKNISVLFHKTKDKKVVKFCEFLGFKEVVEIDSGSIRLSSNTKLYIEKFDDYSLDSWFLLESHGKKILNVNDCVLSSKSAIRDLSKKVGKVDYLFTQFSYANWVGNPEDVELRKKHAQEKLDRIHNQIDFLKPEYLVPFASFVYFCHVDNSFMNETVNTVSDVYNEFNCRVKTLILYPGDVYKVESGWNLSDENIKKYEHDLLLARKKEFSIPPLVKIDEIKESLKDGPFFKFDLKRVSSKILLKSIGIEKIVINLYDLNEVIEFNIVQKSLKQSNRVPDIKMRSQTFHFLVSFLWGPSTVLISGAFCDANKNGVRFINFMSEISQCVSNHNDFNWNFTLSRLFNLFKNKILRLLGQ